MPEDAAPDEIMSEDMIDKALQSLRARIASAERQRKECEQVIVAAKEEETLLLKLLALRRGGAAGNKAGVLESKDANTVIESSNSKYRALREVISALSASGRPLHISELMRLLRSRNIAIPGAGTQANLIAHLRRDVRIVRPSRGMYGLAEWGLEEMRPSGRSRRRRKRIRVRTNT